MDKTKTFYTSKRSAWRDWLAHHYQTETEIWFVFPTVASDEPGLSYNDAVEEALCFGWIDSTAGRMDEAHNIRRFCPRKPGSPYSRPNIERLLWLDANHMLLPEIRAAVAPLLSAPYIFPQDIIDTLRAEPIVWKNFSKFAEPYRRIRVAYIDAARERPDEFAKRLQNFIDKTRQNKLIVGYGGIDKYYGIVAHNTEGGN